MLGGTSFRRAFGLPRTAFWALIGFALFATVFLFRAISLDSPVISTTVANGTIASVLDMPSRWYEAPLYRYGVHLDEEGNVVMVESDDTLYAVGQRVALDRVEHANGRIDYRFRSDQQG